MLPEGYVENYEKIARDFRDVTTIEAEALAGLVAFSHQLLNLPWDAKVCDLGCGNGTALKRIGSIKLTGLDIAFENCKLTRDLSRMHKVVQADAQETPFKTGSFNVVVCTDLFEHVPDVTRLVEEIYRILVPGGVLLFSCPFEQDLSYYESPRYKRKYRYVHLRSINDKLLRKEFKDFTKLAETLVTEHMRYQDMPYPIVFQVYVKGE